MNVSCINRCSAVALCLLAFTAATTYAADPVQIVITGADLAAGQFARNPPFSVLGGALREGARPPQLNFAPTIPAVTFGFYPADLSNPNHNPTIQNVSYHNIFVNPVSLTTGGFGQSPGGPSIDDADSFLDHLNRSDFIHLTDQYTGSTTLSRTVGQAGIINYRATRQTYYDADISVLVHAAARTFGAGYTQTYNIFFPAGTDVCSSDGGNTSVCYSPDDPANFVFCGFHTFTDLDLGHVIFTIEPYENVRGCSVPTSPAGASPNGPAIDSMASVLSHETFEMITDPDLNAWFNRLGAFGGNEIGDECAFVFALPPVTLNGKPYQIQSEYSNFFHACSWTSSGPPTP